MAVSKIVYYVMHTEHGYLRDVFSRGAYPHEYGHSLATAARFETTESREHGVDLRSLARLRKGTMLRIEQEVNSEIVEDKTNLKTEDVK